jgi:hypothetical protein
VPVAVRAAGVAVRTVAFSAQVLIASAVFSDAFRVYAVDAEFDRVTTTSNGVESVQLVVPLRVLVTLVGTVPPFAWTLPNAMEAADVPLPPRVIPDASVTKVRFTEPTVVAVTATVPESVCAIAELPANAETAQRIKPWIRILLIAMIVILQETVFENF